MVTGQTVVSVSNDIRTTTAAGSTYFSPVLPNNPFSLTGPVLTIDQTLDRETRGFYTLPIIATGSIAYATVSENQ